MAAWVANTDLKAIDTGLSLEEATRRAAEFLRDLRERKISAAETYLNDSAIDVLHAACVLLPELKVPDSQNPLEDAQSLFDFIERTSWPDPTFDEKSELLANAAFSAWRAARKKGTPSETEAWRKRFLSLAESSLTIRFAVEEVLRYVKSGDPDRATRLNDPEILLAVCGTLRQRVDRSPSSVRDDAEFIYELLDSMPRECASVEREYFLLELALLAGMTCRLMFRRQDALRWFRRAESKLASVLNSSTYTARLAYQSLALRVEERDFEEVLKLGPRLLNTFGELGLPEDALKCHFLEAVALQEMGRSREAIDVLEKACAEAERMGNIDLLAKALANIALDYRTLGDLKLALSHGQRALALLQQVDDRVNLAKLRWTVGDILREQGKLEEAAFAYREALDESNEIGTRSDSTLIHLVLAEVLLDLGFSEQAEREVRAALPVIEDEKMVPEGYAALALLQESLRRRKIDRQALRNLHGFFQGEKA